MNKPRIDVVPVGGKIIRKQSVHAVVLRACGQCGAPGAYSKEKRVQDGWPGCYDPTRDQQPVGAVCPNCKALRPSPEVKGEIWRREFRADGESLWQRLRKRLRRLTTP